MFGSSIRTIIQTQTLKTNTKMGHWAQKQASAMTIPDLWPEPCRRWVRWTEEKKRHWAVNLKDLERFWMKEWSLISCQVFSNLIRHYRRAFRAVKLKDLEWFWMKEWSLISRQVFSNLIRHYRRTFRAVKLANGGFKKYKRVNKWIKGCR